MDIHSIADQSSDEEIFEVPPTLKEIKRRIISAPLPLLPFNHRQSVDVVNIGRKDDAESSIKIIKSHSAPDISLKSDLHPISISKAVSTQGLSPEMFCEWDIKPDDSFLKLEQMVANMCMTPDKPEVLEDTGTKQYFLTNQTFAQAEVTKKIKQENNSPVNKANLSTGVDAIHAEVQVTLNTEERVNMPFKTPLKNNYIKSKLPNTPHEVFMTPSNVLKSKVPIFKTPGNPPSHKKQLATPRRYQNVASPVATYIRNSPQVPLLKDVCPKRPLPGISSIPKPLKHFSQLNKENVRQESVTPIQQENMKLPAVAYRNAKETKMINIPDKSKMPQNQWAKQVASSIPRALVVKHCHRETSSAKKPLHPSQDNSFADLSLHQADLSVCTQKPTFCKPKKN